MRFKNFLGNLVKVAVITCWITLMMFIVSLITGCSTNKSISTPIPDIEVAVEPDIYYIYYLVDGETTYYYEGEIELGEEYGYLRTCQGDTMRFAAHGELSESIDGTKHSTHTPITYEFYDEFFLGELTNIWDESDNSMRFNFKLSGGSVEFIVGEEDRIYKLY